MYELINGVPLPTFLIVKIGPEPWAPSVQRRKGFLPVILTWA